MRHGRRYGQALGSKKRPSAQELGRAYGTGNCAPIRRRSPRYRKSRQEYTRKYKLDGNAPPNSNADATNQIWDLRTGSIYDAYAYDNPITSMQFDARRIVSAAGEEVAKIYDKTDGRHWNCGPGVEAEDSTVSTVERVRVKDGFLIEGRKDGMVGIWAC